MFPSAEAHLKVEKALKIVDPLAHLYQIVGSSLASGHRREIFGVPFHVFHDLCGFFGLLVVLRHDVVPRKLAQAA